MNIYLYIFFYLRAVNRISKFANDFYLLYAYINLTYISLFLSGP